MSARVVPVLLCDGEGCHQAEPAVGEVYANGFVFVELEPGWVRDGDKRTLCPACAAKKAAAGG